MRIKKNMNILFLITLVSFVGWFVSWGYLTKDLPVELAFLPLEWANWIWMIIPIYTIYYSYKNRQVGKAIRNIIAAVILILVLIPGLIPDNDKVEYKNIYKYEEMLNINFPKNGILINKTGLDIDDNKDDIRIDLAYYKKSINISKLENQIKNEDKNLHIKLRITIGHCHPCTRIHRYHRHRQHAAAGGYANVRT